MGGSFIVARLVRLILASVALFGAFGAPARASAAVDRSVHTCVRATDLAVGPRALFTNPALFDCRTPQADFGAGDFDVLSTPLPAGTGANWPASVRYASPWQDRLTLYALYADGRIVAVPVDGHEASRRLQLGAIIENRLPVTGVPIVRLLWRVTGAANVRGIVRQPKIAMPSENGSANVAMAAMYAAFAGLCLALLVYNIALWCALRHRFQLAYSAMLVMMLVYAASSSGVLAWVVPAIANNDRLRINYVALAGSSVSALAFARTFFEPRVFAGWLARLGNLVMAMLLGSALAYAALAPFAITTLHQACALSFVALLLIVPPMLWRAWRLRSDYLGMFTIAWGTPFVLASLRAANNFGLVASSLWLDNSTLAAMVFEALLSSVAIAYRINLLSRERDAARAAELVARNLADTDPLTGLLNRRAFLRQAIGRPGEQMLMIADLDHFKLVNDTIGHDGGDEVLRLVARSLLTSVPADALVARIGGEEFAIVIAADQPVVPAAILDRLRAERMPYDLTITASIGACAGALTTESEWKALYRAADQALFDAKQAGRDRSREVRGLPLAA